APKYIDPAIKLLNEAGPQIPGSSNKFNLTEFNKLKRWELEFLISSIETSKDELELKKLIKLLLGFDNYTVKYSTENMYYDRDTHTAKTDPGTIIDLNFDIQTADVLRLVVNSEALSEGTRDDAGKALNNILFDKGILDGIYSDVSNPKRFQLIDYLLDLAKDNTKDLLTEGQKSKYELWMNTYKNSQEPASNIDTAKSFKERVAAYLKSSNIDWSKDLKDSIMLELVESVIKKYDKLGADAIDVLLNGDKDDLSVAEYLSKKAKEGDAYAQYRVGILELVLTNNLDKMKLTYASKYKAFTEEADKYVVKVDSNDERLDKLEKARKSVIDGRFEFVR
ncbi:MAG: hypothetical protein WCQ53_05520, partial [bacterium]